jgi:hypothetical protein
MGLEDFIVPLLLSKLLVYMIDVPFVYIANSGLLWSFF